MDQNGHVPNSINGMVRPHGLPSTRHEPDSVHSLASDDSKPGSVAEEFPAPPALTAGDEYLYDDDAVAADKYSKLGRRLAACGDLYRRPEHGGGLLLASPNPNVPPRPILKGAELACIIADRLRLWMVRDGKAKGGRISNGELSTMLGTESFLQAFRAVDSVYNQPVFLSDFSLAQPGYNDGVPGERVLFTGAKPIVSDSMATMTAFLDIMAFATPADRTNAVAAALTVMLRNHWPGEKPLIAVTATKSHAGKETIIEFASGNTPHDSITYETTDWAFQKAVVTKLKDYPSLGLINIENARLGKGDKQIASGFLERFLMQSEPDLQAINTGPSIRVRNDKIVATSTNFGSLSADLLNRALPIHLTPVGDVAERESPIGNPRYEFLPANRNQIQSELLGMIVRWRDAGMPLDKNAKHPFTDWAQIIGGILRVNGFTDFLGNYSMRRTENDPVCRGLGLLGAKRPDEWLSVSDWEPLVALLGLSKKLIPEADRESHVSRKRGLGVVLSAHRGETFVAETDDEVVTLKLERRRGRFENGHLQVRYRFVTVNSADMPQEE